MRCGPRIGHAAAGGHRRAVAPRAARARDTVIAGCGIGPHAAGEAVISVSTDSPRDAARIDSPYRRLPTVARNARGARNNNQTLPSEGRASRDDGARFFRSVPTASNAVDAVDVRSAKPTMMRLCALDGPSLRREGAANRVAHDTARWAATVVLRTDRCGRAECYHARIGDATSCSSCSARRQAPSTEAHRARVLLSQMVPGDDRCCSHSSSLVADPWAARDSRCRFARSLFAS